MRTAYDGEYETFRAFDDDVSRLVSNAFRFNDDDTIYWIGACMLKKDYDDAKNGLKAAGLAHIVEAAPLALME